MRYKNALNGNCIIKRGKSNNDDSYTCTSPIKIDLRKKKAVKINWFWLGEKDQERWEE